MKTILLCILFLCLLLPVDAQNPKFLPRDESSTDPSLQAFAAQLLSVIEKRDEHALFKMLDVDVMSSLGGELGIDEFLTVWDLEDDASPAWNAMKRVVEMGGAFVNDTLDRSGRYTFVYPYVYTVPLDIEDDYLSIAVIFGSKVNLRHSPSTSSPVKAQLDYEVVWLASADISGQTTMGKNPFGDPEWYLIETYDRSQRGWVNWQYIYSPVWYRMFVFQNDKGEWKISAFVAGD